MTNQMQRLDGRVAVVTGGVSGIGRASSLRFLAEGASVVAGDYNTANGERFIAEAAALGYGPDRVRFTRVDVSDEDEVAALITSAVDAFGGLDVMFNNAGIGGAFGAITDVTVGDWDETFHVLVRGVFLGMKHATRQLLAQGRGGSIINTASVAGVNGGGGPVAYSAAKAAVINMTKTVALELAPQRIRVNAICPGAIHTPLLEQGRKPGTLDTALNDFQPWPDGGRPEDIAATAAFLASDDSRFMTGEHLVVDGGLMAAGPSRSGIGAASPGGWVGMNRGTTGQGPTVHRRG